MSVYDTIKERGSIRKFKSEPIPEDKLEAILDSARLAQSAANRQPWEFIVVTDESIRSALVSVAGHQRFVGDAAAVIVCLGDPDASAAVGAFNGFLLDLGIAIENMALTAWDLGIGSCWIGAYNERGIKQLLGVPEKLRVVSLLTLGVPDQEPGPKRRKTTSEIIHRERYGA
jgi:nitroreductase